jgi:SpoVK/Ycf46/Vps4 family AAA+-type ATPase
MNQIQAIEILERYIRARYPIIATLSHEETRVMAAIRAAANSRKMELVEWSITTGLLGEGFDASGTRDVVAAFEAMLGASTDRSILFVMRDLHGALGNADRGHDPLITRYLRDLAEKFAACRNTLVLLSPAFSIPSDLDKTIVLIDWPLPDSEELGAVLTKAEIDLPASIPYTLNGNRDRVIQAMRGLTLFEAESVLSSGIVATRQLGDNIIPFIVKEKAQIIRKAGVLEYYDTDVTMNQVGGLQYLKEYSAIKRKAFSREAAAAGVDAPKGLLLVGIPGTGKSLAAKAIAGGQMPLLRMDVGALMGGLVGQSEGNMRAALKVAEAVAPCALWLDEIEKAISGGGGELDGGTSARVFGTLLTWMQETTAPVYVIATANDIRSLRPELIRRFDDMMWVDLPNQAARVEILTVHLSKRRQDASRIDLESAARATWGFSGAEIEKTVKSALERAFSQGQELSTDYLLKAASKIVPIAVTMENKIKDLRAQAQHALQAGDPLETKPAAVASRAVDLSDL